MLNKPRRVVCWFSCGVASAVATKLALAMYQDHFLVRVVRCVVREEHPDNDRFAKECEDWFGVPILNLMHKKFDGSIYRVFSSKSFVSGREGAPCTRILKKELRQDFEKPTDKHIFGYCSGEQSRWDSFLDANNIDAESPLIDRCISHADALAIVKNQGIELPTMYKLGYKHNNCIGCVKVTSPGYWNKVRKDFPEQFEKMAIVSKRLGARLVRVNGKRIFLTELHPLSGDYSLEPEVQCGVFCQSIENEMNSKD